MLDEMGLKKGTDGYRVMPNGKTLEFTIEYPVGFQNAPETPQLCELVKENWEAVGAKVNIKGQDSTLYGQRSSAGLVDVWMWTGDTRTENTIWTTPYEVMNLRDGWGSYPLWGKWINSGGKEGEKPSAMVLKIRDLCDAFSKTMPGTPEYTKAGKELIETFLNELYVIGTIRNVPQPVLIKNTVGNVPTSTVYFRNNLQLQWPMVWYLKK
jgi:peptide/nickel transport system substrate-binding protein